MTIFKVGFLTFSLIDLIDITLVLGFSLKYINILKKPEQDKC